MRFVRFIVLILITFLFLGSTPNRNTLSCYQIIDRMLDSIKVIRTQRYDLKSTERVGTHLLFAESKIKINNNPLKIYFKSPAKGIEVLWVQGTNKGDAIVHAGTIPFMSFNLDPYGSIMRKDQHHTIFDLGFPYIGKVVSNTIVKAPKDFDKHFASAGTVTWDNKECYQILVSYPEYKYTEYTTTKGETVTSIAYKFNTSDFKIRYKNDLSSYFGAIRERTKLLIPTPYSNKAIFYIDQKTFLPINIKTYDDEGLYEAYEFYNIRINTTFISDEFLKTFKDYKF